jgi:hypothetical protein
MQAKDNVAHTKAKSLNRDYYDSAIILPFSLHPGEWRAWASKSLLFPSCRIFLRQSLFSKHDLVKYGGLNLSPGHITTQWARG